jgi:hypothetical protein
MGEVELHVATTEPVTRTDEWTISKGESWIATMGEAHGIGTTRADALRSLADDLDRRGILATTGDLDE